MHAKFHGRIRSTAAGWVPSGTSLNPPSSVAEQLYIAYAVGVAAMCGYAAVRSFLSKAVGAGDTAKAMAAVGLIQVGGGECKETYTAVICHHARH